MKVDNKITVKPCPFCESYHTVIVETHEPLLHQTQTTIYIECSDCLASGPKIKRRINGSRYNNLYTSKAILKWNDRIKGGDKMTGQERGGG